MKRRARLSAVTVAFGFLTVVVVPQSASAATVNVAMVSGPSGLAFNPAAARLKMGDTARWTNNTGVPHTASASGCAGNPNAGPSAFCSPVVSASGTFSTTLDVAATYSYICTIHLSMQGTVSVSPAARPRSGTVAQTFAISWAKGSVPDGFNADIQIQRPGQGFVDWTTNQSGNQTSAGFTPDAGAGRYAFKVRLQSSTSGNATAYSKAVTITAS